MDKPKCRLCGERHGLSEPHKFASDPIMVADHRPIDAPIMTAPRVKHKPVEELAGKFDKVAYQREYMRKRRAKEGA